VSIYDQASGERTFGTGGTAVAVTTVTVVSIPHLGFNYGQPAQQVALETTASLVALLAGFLVFGRLLKNSWLNELALVAAFASSRPRT